MTHQPLKIAFLSGPANAREIYREWRQQEEQIYFGTDYMKQFLQAASDVGARSFVVSWHGKRTERFRLGDFTFDNRPITESGGLRYYVDHLIWHLRVLATLVAFRPNVLLLTGNQNFWWVLSPLRLLGAKIIISYHAVLWPKLRRPSSIWRMLVNLNGKLILRHAHAILVTSNDIRRQVEHVLARHTNQVTLLNHLPTYSRDQFVGVEPAPDPAIRPFRIFFLARTETNKGIYDIVQMAEKLESEFPGQYRFGMCGSGSELQRLRKRISTADLEAVVECHGYSTPDEVRKLLSEAHACIVPTRSDYEAGFEMTCAEAILAGRPLITSIVCPALEHLEAASIEAAPDDVESYCEAIIKLSSDRELYEHKRAACAALQQQFYDRANSWYAAMRQALDEVGLGDED